MLFPMTPQARAFGLRTALWGLAAGLALGGTVAQDYYQRQLVDLNDLLQANHRAQIEQALHRERVARAAADEAQAELANHLAANAALTQERNHALAAATTGRTCLSERTLRVLDGAPGLRLADVPGASAGDVGAPAALAADPSAPGRAELVSSDADLASWALIAGERYEACRSRVDALATFFSRTGEHTSDEEAP